MTGDVAAFQAGGGGLQARVAAAASRRRASAARRTSSARARSSGTLDRSLGCSGRARDRACRTRRRRPIGDRADSRSATRAAARLRGPADDARSISTLRSEQSRASTGVCCVVVGDGPTAPASSSSRRRARARRARPLRRRGLARRGARAVPARRGRDRCSRSGWENFPHGVVESLARRHARDRDRVGGVAGDRDRRRERPARPAPATRQRSPPRSRRYLGDAELRARLRAAAAPSVARFAPERDLRRLERILETRRAMKPRVLFVGRTRYSAAARRDAARASSMRSASGSTCACSRRRRPARTADATFRSCCRAPRRSTARCFYARPAAARRPRGCGASSPMRSSRRARSRRPPRSLGRATRPRRRAVIVDVHGDWRTVDASLRLAAAPRRRAASPTASAAWAVRQADAVRTVSAVHDAARRARLGRRAGGRVSRRTWTSSRSRAPVRRCRSSRQRSSSACWSCTRTSTASPPPGGVAAPQLPDARSGSSARGTRTDVVEALVARPARRRWDAAARHGRSRRRARRVERARPPLALRGHGTRRDRGASARPRRCSARDVGGIPDLVDDGVNGLLVAARRADALAAALVRLLADRALAAARGRRARAPASAGSRRPRSTPSACGALVARDAGSSSSRSASTPTIRRSGRRSRSCARSPSASTRWSCSRSSRVPVVLPANCPRADLRRDDAALRGAASRTPRSLRSSRRRPSPCSRTCRRSTPCSPRRSTRPLGVPLLLWFTHWRAIADAAARGAARRRVLSVAERRSRCPRARSSRPATASRCRELPCAARRRRHAAARSRSAARRRPRASRP